ncbi:MAG TPA: hypothetical protein DIU15_01015 [Deltaproteobacteria bacterium]|nr:hypothetical protein [Deltaproteobacteria bacterium]HCP44606.1 hypothetical protein [Deltaproteobacteria bacterium]
MRSDSPTSRFIQAGGLRHRILEWEGGRDTVLILHGFLDCAGAFDRFVAHLPPDLHVVAPDFRGHGETEWAGPGGSYHFLDYVRDLRDVVDQVVRDRLFLVGHSMGGGVAVLFAGSYPEDVTRLVLIEGLGPPAEDLADGPTRLARWIRESQAIAGFGVRRFDSLEAVAERLRTRSPELDEDIGLSLAAWLSMPIDGGFTWRHDPRHRVRTASVYRPERYDPFARAVRCPVLLVTGEKSWYRWPDLPDRRRALVDHRLVEIPAAGHMIHYDAPSELASAVLEFVAPSA